MLDHLVFTAPDLQSGATALERALGVPLEPGGEHPQMGTHNRLLGLELPGGERAYLEVIAVNPAAPPPGRPRWFGLDNPPERLALAHWVLAPARWPAAHPEHGEALQLSRGDLSWQLTVPPGGELPMGGVLPSLIAWAGESPAARLPPSSVRLLALELHTPEAASLRARLRELGAEWPWLTVQQADAPRLRAELVGPRGRVRV